MIHVLFVCLGNICRSPMAEAVFNQLLKEEDLHDLIQCDSAGTSDYHIGEAPDRRTLEVVKDQGMTLQHRGRQFIAEDFDAFDYIIAMDEDNKKNILRLEHLSTSKKYQVFLMREFEERPSDLNVPDPYWSGQDGFVEVYHILRNSSRNLLELIRREHQI